jgi:aspartate/methionine/tyrosine aminotransferase
MPPAVHLDNINALVKKAEYAVRGTVPTRAEALEDRLRSGSGAPLPFKQITRCNIGNPQELRQPPLTFVRQLCALVDYPELANHPRASEIFPQDVLERARELVTQFKSTGAYSHSQGIKYVRSHVAEFLQSRDGRPADPDNIFLTNGASEGVKQILQLTIEHDKVGVMIPIPQYPLYSASLALMNGRPVKYYTAEESGWSFTSAELRRSLEEARKEGTDVRALVVINPGNPTGGILSRSDMEDIVRFCESERLLLMADEVYQANVYYPDTDPWHSFRSVAMDLKSSVQLVSFHSVSKGFIGECGKRGGFMDLHNFDAAVRDQLYKLASISLCPNTIGQIVVDVMVKPPAPGSPSYDLYAKERDSIMNSMRRRSVTLVSAFNSLEGVSCQPAKGAMYTFPSITLPAKAVAAAKAAGQAPDVFYALRLLEATGVTVVPGSGFLQKPGTFHFRCTFLPPEETFQTFIDLIKKFHGDFMNQYRD